MKKTILIFTILSCLSVVAKANPNLEQYSTITPLTTDGKLLISSTDATNLSFKVVFSRYASSSGIGFESGAVQYSIIFKGASGAEEVLGGPYNIVSADYNTAGGASAEQIKTVSIAAGKLGGISIKYTYTDNNTGNLVIAS